MTAASAAGPMPPRDKAGMRRSLVSHGLINGCLKVGDVVSLVVAGLAASHIAPGLTLAQSLLLSLVALLPFRLISGNRRPYRWDRYGLLLWEAVDVAVGLAAGVRRDELPLRRREHALQPHDEERTDQVRVDVTRPPADVLLLEPRHAVTDGGLDLTLGFHGQPSRR